MNKFKLLTILVLMLESTVTIQAQEKQNDATWEETIEFITENIEYFRPVDGNYETSVKVNLKNEKIIIDTETYDKEYWGKRCSYNKVIPISKISSVFYFDSYDVDKPAIRFSTKNEFIEMTQICVENRNGKKTSEKTFNSTVFLGVATEALAIRLVKAFKHLVYLANEKNKKSKF